MQPDPPTRQRPIEIELPAPTAWPMVLGTGVTLIFAGLLTSVSVSLLGVVLAGAGCVGWFRDVFPIPREIAVTAHPDVVSLTTARAEVERLEVAESVRAWLPVRTYSVAAGVRGGWVGGVAMALLACAYGVLKAGSVWVPINLLASVVYAQSIKLGPDQLTHFHGDSFAIAVLLHALGSTLVGLLYGAMLPMLPRRPIVLGGLIAPVLWSGTFYSILGLINPVLQDRIDWLWFIASQVAFGVVAGLVVLRHRRVPTRENLSFALRAGLEAPGILPPRGDEGGRP
jgi:hypothetical protein